MDIWTGILGGTISTAILAFLAHQRNKINILSTKSLIMSLLLVIGLSACNTTQPTFDWEFPASITRAMDNSGEVGNSVCEIEELEDGTIRFICNFPCSDIDFLIENPDLPNLLLTQKGKSIHSTRKWHKNRKNTLLNILNYEYGTTPETQTYNSLALSIPDTITHDELAINPYQEFIQSEVHFNGLTQRSEYTLYFGLGAKLSTTLHLYIPNDGQETHPIIVRFGLGGEHAQAANERGYAFACFEQTSLDPDTEGHDVVGPAQEMYPDATWGSVAVWAWGASRVMDYLETREDIDTTRSVITGHSRTGKAALLAGVLDERFAVVVPNGSGAGGAATFRGAGKGNETLELITRESRFKSWFHEDFGQFGEHVNKLPFDQHYMRALIAPRVVLSTDAYDDKWCYPEGVQMAWEGAQPVFDLLGVPEHNLIHFREGGHDQLAPDFDVLLDVADAHFNGESFPKNLRTAPFPK